VLLSHWGKKSGAPGGRSLAYVLGNMLSAGGEQPIISLPSPETETEPHDWCVFLHAG
jgi:hypothetical protein